MACTLILSSLVSCKKKSDEDAGTSKTDAPCVITVDFDFSCDDDVISVIFEQLENNKTVIYLDNGKFKAENNSAISYNGENVYKDTYVVIDGMIYEHFSYSLNGVILEDDRVKAPISGEESDRFLKELCLFGGISASGFSEIENESLDGCDVSTYRNPDTDNKIVLEKMMVSMLEGYCDLVSITDATVTVKETEDGYSEAVVSGSYEVTILEVKYNLSVSIRLSFDYTQSFDITAPTDEGEYVAVEIKSIIGE